MRRMQQVDNKRPREELSCVGVTRKLQVPARRGAERRKLGVVGQQKPEIAGWAAGRRGIGTWRERAIVESRRRIDDTADHQSGAALRYDLVRVREHAYAHGAEVRHPGS